jgi:hypothetical protein
LVFIVASKFTQKSGVEDPQIIPEAVEQVAGHSIGRNDLVVDVALAQVHVLNQVVAVR